MSALAFTAVLSASAQQPPAAVRAEFAESILWTHARGAGRYAFAAPPTDAQAEAFGFTLAQDLGCRSGGDEEFCSAARPKAWTASEIAAFRRQLARLHTPALRGFFERVRGNGFTTIVRQQEIVHRRRGKGGWQRFFYPNTLRPCRHIVMADAQFTFSNADESIVHLMAHAYDFVGQGAKGFFPTLSVSADFLRMSGFALGPRGWQVKAMSPADRAEYWRLFERRNEELLKTRALPPAERKARDREIRRTADAFGRKFGALSFHSLLNPYESFADWAAVVYAREAEARALNPELTRWFKEKVLR